MSIKVTFSALRKGLATDIPIAQRVAKSLESHVAHRPHAATHPTGGVDAPTGASPGNGVVAATPRSSSRQHTHGRVEATPLHLTRRGWGLGYSTGAAALGRQQPRTLTSSSVAVFVVAPLVLGPPTLLPHTGAGLLACVATTVALDCCPSFTVTAVTAARASRIEHRAPRRRLPPAGFTAARTGTRGFCRVVHVLEQRCSLLRSGRPAGCCERTQTNPASRAPLGVSAWPRSCTRWRR